MECTSLEVQRKKECGIIGIINRNLALGNITYEDALKLKNYTLKLRDYICDHLGAEGLEGVRGMTDHSFMTEADIICEELEDTKQKLENAEQRLEDTELKLEDAEQKNEKLQEKLRAYEVRYGVI